MGQFEKIDTKKLAEKLSKAKSTLLLKNKELYMLIGYPRSGKSTYIEKCLSNTITVSADIIRQQLLGQEFYDNAETMVWMQRRYLLEYLLMQGVNVAIDETNLLYDRRMETVSLAKQYGYEVKYVHITTGFETCLARINKEIELAKGNDVISRKMQKKFAMQGMYERGLEDIKEHEFDDIEALPME